MNSAPQQESFARLNVDSIKPICCLHWVSHRESRALIAPLSEVELPIPFSCEHPKIIHFGWFRANDFHKKLKESCNLAAQKLFVWKTFFSSPLHLPNWILRIRLRLIWKRSNLQLIFYNTSKLVWPDKFTPEIFFPEANRFQQLDELEWAFGSMGMQDKAKRLATLFLEDLSDFIIECIDPEFGFSRYAERLGRSANSFDEWHTHLQGDPSFIDQITLQLLREKLDAHQPKLVYFSVPFPGNLYSAFRCASYLKMHFPTVKIAMGGGFPNTELRSISDPRVFDYFDFITLDDGDSP